MEINVDNEHKLVELWLSHDEQNDPAFLEALKLRYKEYAAKKYLVAVFHSGRRDLYEATADLLCYNRKRTAQLEVAREKRQGTATAG